MFIKNKCLTKEVESLKNEKEILTKDSKRVLDNGLYLKSLINDLLIRYDELKNFLNTINTEINVIINELISVELTLDMESNFIKT